MEQQPPLITITDPNAPARTADVLESGTERQPWAPSRRQKKTTAVVVAVLALMAGVTVAVDHVRADRAADRAAVKDLRVVVTPYNGDVTDGQMPTMRLVLRNDGTLPVRVLSARLNTGQVATAAQPDLAPGVTDVLTAVDTVTCTPALLTHPVTAVLVTLRTKRGTRLTRKLPMDAQTTQSVNAPSRERCGYFEPQDSFGFDVVSSRSHGRTSTVEVNIYNRSVLPLTLQRLRALPGLTAKLDRALPLALRPQANPDTFTQPRSATLTLRVKSCAVFNASINGSFDPSQLLTAWLVRDGTVAEVSVPFFFQDPGAIQFPESPDVVDPIQPLLQACAGG